MLSDEVIKDLNEYENFKIFMRYFLELVNDEDSSDGLLSLSDNEAGEKIKIRGNTKRLMLQLFKPFLSFNEKKEPTKKERKEAGKKFGLS